MKHIKIQKTRAIEIQFSRTPKPFSTTNGCSRVMHSAIPLASSNFRFLEQSLSAINDQDGGNFGVLVA